MAQLIVASNSVAALGKLLSSILQEGQRLSDRVELLSVLISVGSAEGIGRTREFVRQYMKIVGREFWDRAEQLYLSSEPLRWKVSYRGRLTGVGKGLEEENQLQHILASLVRTPGANTLSFSFYRPGDHRRAQALPASMPCPIAGDFKYRQSRLHLNVFFRTQDAYRLGFPDLFFMRAIQREILDRARGLSRKRFGDAKLGELNVFFSRVFILNRHRSEAKLLLEAANKFRESRQQ